MRGLHIFALEAYAACRGAHALRTLIPDVGAAIFCTDNTALAGAMRRGYSSVDMVSRWMSEEMNHLQIEVMTVVSADMPADYLSRGEDGKVDMDQLHRLHHAWLQGRRTGSGGTDVPKFSGQIRHQECELETMGSENEDI